MVYSEKFPDYDDPKEVYAIFGLTFYKVNVLEQGLINKSAGVLSSDNKLLKKYMKRDNYNNITLDDIYTFIDEKTLGMILFFIKENGNLSEELLSKLEKVLKYRNYLAHKFFEVNAIKFVNEKGRVSMIDELLNILDFVNEVDVEVDELWLNSFSHLGLSKDMILEKAYTDLNKHKD